jgi:hypothetical protein
MSRRTTNRRTASSSGSFRRSSVRCSRACMVATQPRGTRSCRRRSGATCPHRRRCAPRMHKQIDEWCARCPICATRLRAQRPTPRVGVVSARRPIRRDSHRRDANAAVSGGQHVRVDDRRPHHWRGARSADEDEVDRRHCQGVPARVGRCVWLGRVTAPRRRARVQQQRAALDVSATWHAPDRRGPYNKQANGLVERFIQTVKRALLARLHGSDTRTGTRRCRTSCRPT